MHIGRHKYHAPKHIMVGEEAGNAETQSIPEGDAKVSGQTEQDVKSDVHGKITQSESDVLKQVMRSISKNPGRTILISLVIGVGLVFVLRRYFQSHTGRLTLVKASSALLGRFYATALRYLKKQYKKLGKVNILKEIEDRYA